MRRTATFAVALLLAAACSAREPSTPEPAPPEPPPAETPDVDEVEKPLGERADESRARATQRAQDVAQWFDTFFGDDRVEDESASTQLRVEAAFEVAEGPELRLDPRVKARVALPRFQGYATALVIESLSPDGVEDSISGFDDDLPVSVDPDEEDSRGVSAALRWLAYAEENYNVSLDAGLRFKLPPEPFVKLRARQRFDFVQGTQIYASQTPFWIIGGDGLGITLQGDLRRSFLQSVLARFGGRATRSTESDGVEWALGPELFWRVDDRAAIEWRLKALGRTEPAAIVRVWTTELRWRQQVWRPWLFYGIEPKVSWPDKEDRTFTPSITFRLGMLLDPERDDIHWRDMF